MGGFQPARARRSVATGALVASLFVSVVVLDGRDAQAGITTFAATADTYVNGKQPGKGFGSAKALKIRNNFKNIYVRFAITGVGSSDSITAGQLRLFATTASTCSAGAEILRAGNDTWSENATTWNNQPGAPGSVIASRSSWTDESWVTFDVGSALTGNGNVSFLIRMPTTCTTGSDSLFRSRETPSDPELIVTTASPSASPSPSPSASQTLSPSPSPSVEPSPSPTVEPSASPSPSPSVEPSPSISPSPSPSVAPVAQCADGVDNDIDGFFDHPADLGCSDGDDDAEEDGSESLPVIAAAGDVACSPNDPDFNDGAGTATHCRMMATSDILVGNAYDAVLLLGDAQYESGLLADFQASYDPSWGRVKSITRPAVGNHEYALSSEAAGYFDYFGALAGERPLGYFSFELGAWHLISLNSVCNKIPAGSASNGCGNGSPQYEWLEADLATTTATCVMAYWHHPRFSSTQTNRPMNPIWNLLYANGADVVLNGHKHIYERFAPMKPDGAADPTNGIRQFVVGRGGKNLGSEADPIIAPMPTSEALELDTYGVLSMRLAATGYTWRFVPVAGSSYTDGGSYNCH